MIITFISASDSWPTFKSIDKVNKNVSARNSRNLKVLI